MSRSQYRIRNYQPAFTVESRRHGIVLVADFIFADDDSPAAVADQRRRFLASGYLEVPPTAFFLMACPEVFHLWKPNACDDALPAASASAASVLYPYFGSEAPTLTWWSRSPIESCIESWLSGLADWPGKRDESAADRMIVEAGLYDLMRHGKVRYEPTP